MPRTGSSGIARATGCRAAATAAAGAAALVLACCGSETSAGPSASATAGSSGVGSPEASSTSNHEQGQNRGTESFLDRLLASGDEHLLRVEEVPRAGSCRARAFRQDSRADVSGPDLRVAGRRTPQDDGTFTWSWDGDLISISPEGSSPGGSSGSATGEATPAPSSQVRVQLLATCIAGGLSRTLSLAVTVSP